MIQAIFIKNINWPKQLAIFLFMASGTLIVFSYVIFGDRQFTSPILFFIYLLPWVMIWSFRFCDVILIIKYRIEIILMTAILFLGILNVLMSDNIYLSCFAMKMFIISGIIPLWTSMFLFETDGDRKIFNYFSCGWLLIIVVVEMVNYINSGRSFLFLNHAIPIGTLVILLMVGPLVLSVSGPKKIKLFSIALIFAGLLLIIITNKRGTFLALAGMALAWIYYRYIRLSFIVFISLCLCLIICYFGLIYYKSLDKYIPSHNSILHRLELYPFALHVYLKHPYFGTGLRAYSHERYLNDFNISNKSLDKFSNVVKELQTFDNMVLTGFVELGTIMTLLYASLIIIIVYKYCRNIHPFATYNGHRCMLLIPLLGLAMHSITYDSLMFPQINWLFHVQLGILNGLASRHDH